MFTVFIVGFFYVLAQWSIGFLTVHDDLSISSGNIFEIKRNTLTLTTVVSFCADSKKERAQKKLHIPIKYSLYRKFIRSTTAAFTFAAILVLFIWYLLAYAIYHAISWWLHGAVSFLSIKTDYSASVWRLFTIILVKHDLKLVKYWHLDQVFYKNEF